MRRRSSYPLAAHDLDDAGRAAFRAESAGLRDGVVALALLVHILERRSFPSTDGRTYRLAAEDVEWLRAEIVRRIEAAGGRVELGDTVATTATGELRITMA